MCRLASMTSRSVLAKYDAFGYASPTRPIISLKLTILDATAAPPASGPAMPRASLKVLLIADQDVGGGRDLGKDRAKLLLAALPERRTVVQVERDPRTVPLRGPGDLKAEAARVRRQRSDHARQMQDPRPLPTEDPVEVEVVHVERAADLTGAVVVHARTAATSTAVGNVELMPITPRRPLRDLRTLIGHVPAGEIMLDQRRDRTARNKRRQHLHR